MAFIPTSREEMRQRGWDELDVIFVYGDAYVDHPAFGVPLLARWLERHGFRAGIISQPDWRSPEPFQALGAPRLFFAVSSGAMDSMVAHYTPARKLRHDDAYTPGNRHGARPNRATLVYTSRLKECFRQVPVVIGGIEASLRRFVHYDFWEDKLRRSLLLDAKADVLVYGMAERSLLELASRMRRGERLETMGEVRGTCRVVKDSGADAPHVELPSYEACVADKMMFAEAFRLASGEQNPHGGRTLIQRHGERLLVCYPPALPLTEREMDAVYALPFEKAPHPSYRETIPAWEQIKCSITSHRGCLGGCAFCAITMHQGRAIQSRSEQSILNEVKALASHRWFRGSISDVGGPTANMYGLSCGDHNASTACRRESCLFPRLCPHLVTDDRRAARLLRRIRALAGVKHVAVSSGIRYDLLERQPEYCRELLGHHVGGLLKVAPEHLVDRVNAVMRKPGGKSFETFLRRFGEGSARLGKRQHVVPYLMSGHPGCTLADMLELALTLKQLGLRVEQVQDFTPTPGTLATCMYYTGIDPMHKTAVYVPRGDREKSLQKALLLWHLPGERKRMLQALGELGRDDLAEALAPARGGVADYTLRKPGTGRQRGSGVAKGPRKRS